MIGARLCKKRVATGLARRPANGGSHGNYIAGLSGQGVIAVLGACNSRVLTWDGYIVYRGLRDSVYNWGRVTAKREISLLFTHPVDWTLLSQISQFLDPYLNILLIN